MSVTQHNSVHSAPGSSHGAQVSAIRHDWTREEVEAFYAMPFNDLLFQAQIVHRQHFDPNETSSEQLVGVESFVVQRPGHRYDPCLP